MLPINVIKSYTCTKYRTTHSVQKHSNIIKNIKSKNTDEEYRHLQLIYKPLLKYSVLGTASALTAKYVAALSNFSGS